MSARKLAVQVAGPSGNTNYTSAGQADADLTSAVMALDQALNAPSRLTAAQIRDLTAARNWAMRASRAVSRHMDYDLDRGGTIRGATAFAPGLSGGDGERDAS